jgi:anti-sigma B factor antagonist
MEVQPGNHLRPIAELLTPEKRKYPAPSKTRMEPGRLQNCALLNISALAAVFYFSGRSASFLPSRGGTSMSVRMTNSEVDGVSVVELDGRIVLGEESNSLREKLKSLVAAGKKKIVLNMANIKYIDSSGLGALVAAHVSAKTQGASVRICNLGKKFHDVMQVTRLLTVFDVYDTQAAAISSF